MIRVERAQIEDVPDIKYVLSETWRDTYNAILPSETSHQITSEWHAPEVLQREIQNPELYFGVARDEHGTIVGLVTAHQQADAIVIGRIYVLPLYQRRGIGQRLLESSCTAFPQANHLRLEVEAQNEIGLTFYQKQGFQEVGRREQRVGDTPLTALVLEKSLAMG